MLEATASTQRAPAPAAGRLPLVSREHGANLMAVHALLLGLVAAFASGDPSPGGLVLAVAFVAMFLPFAAAVSALSRRAVRRRARDRIVALSVVIVAVAALGLALGPWRELVGLGAGAALLAGIYAGARAATGPRSVVTQLAAIAGISLFAPLAWLLAAGPTPGWQLSAPSAFLAFGGTVPYVRERVRRRKALPATPRDRLRGGAAALLWQATALGGATGVAVAGAAGWLLPAAFVPSAVKTVAGIVAPERRPPIARIGVVETVVSTVFAVAAGIALAG